ncbi:hypothetical protein Ancab_013479, partial [Ancistrocladus abbreviatus]
MSEAKWVNKKYVPNYDEYLANAMVSSACTLVMVGSYLGMGEITEKEAFESVKTNPKATRAAGIIVKLMNDIGDHKYDVSKEVVHDEFHKQIENAWMDLNEEILGSIIVPMPLLDCILNYCRAMDFICKDLNGYAI